MKPGRWLFWLMLALVLALAATTAAMQLRRSGKPDSARSGTELTMLAKMALVGSSFPGTAADAYEAPLLTKLDELEKSPVARERARALRRRAIWCSLRDLPCVTPALDALDRIAPEDRLPAPADEAAVLREVLSGDPIAPDRAAALAARLPEIRLGWFDRLLRERLYRHAGDLTRADAEHSSAVRSALLAMVAMLAFTALLGAGGIAWLVLLFSPARARILARLKDSLRNPTGEHANQSLRDPAAHRDTDGRDKHLHDLAEQRPDAAPRRLGVVASFLAMALALPQLAGQLRLVPADDPTSRALWTFALEVLLLLVVLLEHRVFCTPAGLTLGFKRVRPLRALWAGLFSYLLLWPVLLLILIPLGALFERLGLPTQSHPIAEQLQSASDNPAALTLWFLIAAVLAPLLEEAVFRGALQSALQSRLGGRASLLLVALLFAIIHPQIGLGLVGIFVIGLALSLVRLHEGSLWPGVVLHAINNGVALLLALAFLSG